MILQLAFVFTVAMWYLRISVSTAVIIMIPAVGKFFSWSVFSDPHLVRLWVDMVRDLKTCDGCTGGSSIAANVVCGCAS